MGIRRGWGLGKGLGPQRGVEGLRKGLQFQGVKGLRGQLEGLRGVGARRGLRLLGQGIWISRGVQIYRGYLNIWGAYKHMGVYGCPLSLHKQAS